MKLYFFTFIFILDFFIEPTLCGMVKVKIYDHRAEHDPNEFYGNGPWKYFGHGYGLEYQYEPDGTYERQKGYGFLKVLGRDFCKTGVNCRPSDPYFFDKLFAYNGMEPYWGHPPGDVIADHNAHSNGDIDSNYV